MRIDRAHLRGLHFASSVNLISQKRYEEVKNLQS